MAAKPQRSIRFEDEAFNGVLRVQLPDETFTATVNRVLLVGVDAIEGETQAKPDKTQFETQKGNNETQTKPSETQAGHDATALYVQRLEDENARLIAEHEADRAAIAEKDKQLAQALNKSLELAEQANVLARITHEKALPATTAGEEIAVVMDGEQIAQEPTDETPAQVDSTEPVEQPKKRSFWARLWE